MPQQRITREDVDSLVEARRELGHDMGMLVARAGIVGVNFAFSRNK